MACLDTPKMNRIDFQELAKLRLREAEALFVAGLWEGAYYLAGYAIGCGLKACISKTILEHSFPPKPEIARDFYQHDLSKLLKHSGFQDEFEVDRTFQVKLQANWDIVKGWNVESARYDRLATEPKACAILSAIRDPDDGILTWIMNRW